MSSPGRPKTLIFWVLLVTTLAFGVLGWVNYFRARRASTRQKECQVALNVCEKEVAVVQREKEQLASKKIAKVAKKATLPKPFGGTPGLFDAKKLIDKKARSLAEKLSNEKVERYKEKEKEKRAGRFHKHMETAEAGFVAAINRYVKDNAIDDTTARKMHDQVEQAFLAHKKRFEEVQAGKISRKDSRKKAMEQMEKDKAAMVALMGEDEYENFLKEYLGPAMKEEFERQRNQEETKSETE